MTSEQIKRETHTVGLMRHHYFSKEETGGDEQVQLHVCRCLSGQINNLQYSLAKFNTA